MNLEKTSDQPQEHQDEEKKISQLRQEFRDIRDANNLLVDEIWNIKLQLQNDSLPSEDKVILSEKITSIEKMLQEKNYSAQIQVLIEDIKQREMRLYGRSDFNSTSPFRI